MWARVVPTEDGCWLWDGATYGAGYGVLRKGDGSGNVRATHIMWRFIFGEWPTGHVLHTCDNPSCVRPDHLFTGTDADNVADKVQKGRQPYGEQVWNTKLSGADAILIRRLKDEGLSYAKIARVFGVSINTVVQVVKRKSFKWVE